MVIQNYSPRKNKRETFLASLAERIHMVERRRRKVYCDICEMTGKKNPFTTTGCNNYQKTALERHQNSKDHITSISDLKLRKSFQVSIKYETKEIMRRHVVQLRM